MERMLKGSRVRERRGCVRETYSIAIIAAVLERNLSEVAIEGG